MEITNKAALPQPLVDAVRNDSYDRGESDITVTELIDSPMIRYLRHKYKDEIEEDVLDRIWSLLGQAVHAILERANSSGIAEKRLYATFNGVKVGGQLDHYVLLPDGVLEDYKVTSVWAVIYGKTSWENQLNVLAELCEHNGYEVRKLRIVAVLRDWQKSRANEDGYPSKQIAVIDVPLWPEPAIDLYLGERLMLHFEEEPTCSDEERWKREDTWAVMQKGKKRALRVFPDEGLAQLWCSTKGLGRLEDVPGEQNSSFVPFTGISIQHRPGSYPRCESYCEVSKFCPIWQAHIARAKEMEG